MCELVEGLVYDTDIKELTEDEVEATTVVSLFGTDNTWFKAKVSMTRFDPEKFRDFISTAMIENSTYEIEDLSRFPIDFKLTRAQLLSEGWNINEIWELHRDDLPEEKVVATLITDVENPREGYLCAQHWCNDCE